MPRQKYQKTKRATRVEKIQERIKDVVTEHAERMGKDKYMPDDHYITISHSGPRQLSVTTIHKDVYQGHPELSKHAHKVIHEVAMEQRSWDDVLKEGFTYTIDY